MTETYTYSRSLQVYAIMQAQGAKQLLLSLSNSSTDMVDNQGSAPATPTPSFHITAVGTTPPPPLTLPPSPRGKGGGFRLSWGCEGG